jgi:iron complex outermembrane receptor protein
MKALSRILALAAAAAIAMPVTVLAQGDDGEIEEVVVTGTRSKPRSAADSPVPIDTFNADQLSQQPVGGMTENLKNLVPSFSATPMTGDGSAMVRSTSLRGLPPDEVLLLVNSKRRHRSSLIQHFGAAMSQGSHAADMGMIPSIALKNVEVLRDGAAAQYGSDAIAGVINFILDDSSQGGRVEAQYGQYYEGETSLKVAANIGLPLSDNGFANFSAEWTDDEQLIRGHQPYDAAYLAELGVAPAQDSPYSGDNLAQTWGRPETYGLRTAWNLGLDLGNGGEAYAFGNYASTYGNYRFFYREIVDNTARGGLGTGLDSSMGAMPIDPTDPSMGNFCWCDVLPGGFTPYLVGKQTDFSSVVGVRGDFSGGMLYDFTFNYGSNRMDYTLHNTISPTYGPGTSTSSYAPGDLKEHDTSLNADFSYPLSDTVNVAFGLEWREENYTMFAGDAESWIPGPWAEVGELVDPLAPATCGVAMNEPCNYATPPNGSNGLPGTPAGSAGEFSRDNWSVYGDVEWDVSDALLLQVALRFEDFSDFGTTTNGKVAARYSVSDSFTLRGAYSTGFRAPTPGQSNLETIVLTFDSTANEQNLEGTLRPTDPLLTSFGGQALEPEDATNISIGFTADVGSNFSITADYYQIEVEDRIVKTFNLDVPASFGVEFTKIAFYTNGLETETTGFDLILLYNVDWAGGSSTDFSLAWNSNDTKITGVSTIDHDGNPATPEVAPVTDGVIFNIENNLPENRFSFAANHHMDKWGLTLRANWYDKTSDESSGGLPVGAALMVDIEGRYAFSDSLTLILGANNVFDEFPNDVGILQYPIESVRNHQGLTYPRRSPIGYDGGSWYLKAVYNF